MLIKRGLIILTVLLLLFSVFNSKSADYSYAENNFASNKTIIIEDDINYPPYSFIDEHGNPSGFNVELAIAVCKAMGYEAEIRLEEWTNVRNNLEEGNADAISGMFYSQQRDLLYDFTVKHSISTSDIFSNKDTFIDSLDDLRGETVVIQKGDIAGEYIKSLNLDITLIEVFSVDEALTLIEEGKYDYAALVSLPGLYNIKKQNLKNVKANNLGILPNDYCMAVKDGNLNLKIILDSGLQIVKATGEYDKIYDKWLGVYEEKSISDYLSKYNWIIAIAIGLIITLLIITYILERIVSRKTYEIRKQNQLLVENENELIKSEEKNRAILESLPDNVFIINRENKIVGFHISREQDLYIPLEKLVGASLKDLIPEYIYSELNEKISLSFASSDIQQMEYEVCLNGETQYFELRTIKINDNQILAITRNVTKDRSYLDWIEYLSFHDQLTGLYNRRFFELELERLDNPSNYPLCIIMADVNGLKLINDSFGHRMGDELLIKVASVLKDACKEKQILSRIGGDEFVIIIPNSSEEGILSLIKKIQALADIEKVGAVNLSISFGWDIKYKQEQEIHEIFNKAENTMYKNKLFESPSMRSNTIDTIIGTLNEKNKREELHSRRVSDISAGFAKAIGLSDISVEEIRTTGLLHDIGKIAISEEILNNKGTLTEEEFAEIKRHPEIGYRILSSVNEMADIANYTLYHHERWDGKGYPGEKKGEEIPLESRIICIADAFDAMTSDRTYRKSNSIAYAVSELNKNRATQFDPILVDQFIEKMVPVISEDA